MPNIQYLPRPGYTDHTTRGSHILSICLLPPPWDSLVVVLEKLITCLRVYRADTLALETDLELSAAAADLRVPLGPLAFTFHEEQHLLMASTTQLVIKLWKIDAENNFTLRGHMVTTEPQVRPGCPALVTCLSCCVLSVQPRSTTLTPCPYLTPSLLLCRVPSPVFLMHGVPQRH